MFCFKCGTQMEDEWVYCPKCGANVKNGNSASSQEKPVNPQKGERTFSPGFLSNIKLTIDDNFFKYRGAYGDEAIVPIKSIVAVTTTPNGWGKSDIVIVGSGTELARIKKQPTSWAQDILVWVTKEIEL